MTYEHYYLFLWIGIITVIIISIIIVVCIIAIIEFKFNKF